MLVKIIKQYKDKEIGKVYDKDDLRDVSAARGQVLIEAGVAEAYTPKHDDQKTEKTPKGCDDRNNKGNRGPKATAPSEIGHEGEISDTNGKWDNK